MTRSSNCFEVILHKEARKAIQKAPAAVRRSVKEAIDMLSEIPIPRTAVRIVGRKNVYRIRFGDWRMLYEVHATEVVVYIFGFGHRREVCRKLLKAR